MKTNPEKFLQKLKLKYAKSTSFMASIIIHTLLLGFLLLSVQTGIQSQNRPAPKGEIVQAVVYDQKTLDVEVKKLETEQKNQALAEEERQKAQQQKVEQMKKTQVEEQKKLDKVKQDLAKAKQEEEKERKELEDLKVEKMKKQKDMTALEDQRQAEQERVKEMRLQREKEEKKRAQLAKQQKEAKRKADEAKHQADLKTATEHQAFVDSEVQKIIGIWGEKIRSNKREAFGMPVDLYCKLAITVLPDGSVQVQMLQSSGNAAYDDLSIKAVYKSQPFQLPEEPSVRDQVKAFELGLRNDEDMG